MYTRYDDILSRIAETPKWWSYGVPRFDDFEPQAAGVYGGQRLLVRIACPGCWTMYDVAVSGSGRTHSHRDRIDLYADVDVGDPPNACCDGGASMQAWALQVIEFWDRTGTKSFEWVRDPHYEVYLDDAFDERSPLREAATAAGRREKAYDYFCRHGLDKEFQELWSAPKEQRMAEL